MARRTRRRRADPVVSLVVTPRAFGLVAGNCLSPCCRCAHRDGEGAVCEAVSEPVSSGAVAARPGNWRALAAAQVGAVALMICGRPRTRVVPSSQSSNGRWRSRTVSLGPMSIHHGRDSAVLLFDCVQDRADRRSRKPSEETAQARAKHASSRTITTDPAHDLIQITEAV